MKVCPVRPLFDAVPIVQPIASANLHQRRMPQRAIVRGLNREAGQGAEIRLRGAPAERHRRRRAQMTTAMTSVLVPQRMWFANTGSRRFHALDRAPDDVSPFTHWLAAGRVIMRPQTGMPGGFDATFDAMLPGDAIFAYEDRHGIVAMGRVRYPKDVRTEHGPTALFPDARTAIHSLAVDWDTSVTRSMVDISSRTKVGGRPLQAIDPTTALYPIVLELLVELHARQLDDPDASEANALARLNEQAAGNAPTRVQVSHARVGQGAFRAAVLAREPACRMTGVSMPRCLVASHIKPWAVCVGGEHLDGANGLMLAPHIDFLFDTGLISFTDDGQLILAPTLDPAILYAWHIAVDQNVGTFAPDQAHYLAYHRTYVLGQPRPRRQRNLVGDVPLGAINVDLATHTQNVTLGVL
jgi:hypothetical protein